MFETGHVDRTPSDLQATCTPAPFLPSTTINVHTFERTGPPSLATTAHIHFDTSQYVSGTTCFHQPLNMQPQPNRATILLLVHQPVQREVLLVRKMKRNFFNNQKISMPIFQYWKLTEKYCQLIRIMCAIDFCIRQKILWFYINVTVLVVCSGNIHHVSISNS